MPAPLTNPWLAVRPFGDRLAEALALRRLNEAFQSGRDVAGQLRGVVAQSWKRSGAAGIDPVDHVAPIVMDEREVADRWPQHPLHSVLPLIREVLSGATSESAHMLVISDANGVLMQIEGHSQVVEATEHMHLVPGADWSERGAGTNALGTAIALDHPVQIFSAEHFTRSVHPWQCSGAPIHDPQTGAILGVIDLTGHLRSAHPHTLNLVTAAAGIAEAHLRQEYEHNDARLRAAYVERIAGAAQPTALVRPSGQVVAAIPHGWLPPTIGPVGPGEVELADGTIADAEPLAHGALVLWRRARVAAGPKPPAIRLELFGRSPRVCGPAGTIPLSGRHAEILCTLVLLGRGLTAEELTLEVYGETGKPGTLRAEMSRLRRLLGDLLQARPYALALQVTSDLQEAETMLAHGRVAEALALADERLLPGSEAPRVVEARDRLEHGLREAILRARDPNLLDRWCRAAAGQDDAPAAQALLALLPRSDRRVAGAEAHLARLERSFA